MSRLPEALAPAPPEGFSSTQATAAAEPAPPAAVPSGEAAAPAPAPAPSAEAPPAPTARPPLPAFARPTLEPLFQALRASGAPGEQTLRLRLEGEDGTLTVRTRRAGERVEVAVGFSEGSLQARAAASVERLRASLQEHFGTEVEVTLLADTPRDGNAGGESPRDSRREAPPPAPPAPPPRPAPPTPTARQPDRPHEWVG